MASTKWNAFALETPASKVAPQLERSRLQIHMLGFKFKHHGVAAFIFATIQCFSTASPLPQTGPDGLCDNGTLLCCNDIQNANSFQVQMLAGLLGISSFRGATGQAGLACFPLVDSAWYVLRVQLENI